MDLRAHLDKIISDAEAGERSPHRALTRPRLRPYLPDRHTLRVLAAGLAVIARAALRPTRQGLRAAFTWTTTEPAKKATPGLQDRLEQLAGGALILAIAAAILTGAITAAGPHIAPYLPAAAVAGTVVLVITALYVAPDIPRKAAERPEPEPLEDLADNTEDDPDDRRLAFLRWLEKTTRGTTGLHLDQMHRQLTEMGPAQDLPRHHLRPLLDHYQIPVQRTLRVGPVAGRSGVTRQAIIEALTAATVAPPLDAETGMESAMETRSDLPVSPGSPGALQPAESGS